MAVCLGLTAAIILFTSSVRRYVDYRSLASSAERKKKQTPLKSPENSAGIIFKGPRRV